MTSEYAHWYPTDCEFVWAYSKYFWESHVELPELDIGEVEAVVDSVVWRKTEACLQAEVLRLYSVDMQSIVEGV